MVYMFICVIIVIGFACSGAAMFLIYGSSELAIAAVLMYVACVLASSVIATVISDYN